MAVHQEVISCEKCGLWHYTKDHEAVIEAGLAEDKCREKSVNFRIRNKCEVCMGDHRTYECCDKCNYDIHFCHFCGDYLGHDEVSACYILEEAGI